MGRNSSKSVSAVSINATNKEDTNMNVLTMERPVTAAFDASDTVKLSDLTTSEIMKALESTNEEAFEAFVSSVGQGESRTAVEACSYYNPSYQPATPHVIKSAVVSSAPVEQEQDLLAPYTGKKVTLAYYTGKDQNGKDTELGFAIVAGENARTMVEAVKANKLSVIIRCADTNAKIYTHVPVKGASKARVTSGTTVAVAKGATPEQIAAREEAARVKEDTRINAMYAEAEAMNAKFDIKMAALRAKEIAEHAKKLAIALKATRTSPDADDHNIHAFTLLKAEEGATCKELNFNDDEVRGNEYGTCNDGWKQKAERFALTYNHKLYQSARPCKRSPSKISPMTVFKLVAKGEEAGIGWWDITPSK